MEKQTKTGFRRTTGKLTAWLLTGALLLSSGVCPDVSAAGKVMIKNMPAVKYMPAGSSFLVKANQKNAKLSFTSSKKNVDIPIINIIEETVKYAIKTVPGLKTLGVLATEGTIKIGRAHV